MVKFTRFYKKISVVFLFIFSLCSIRVFAIINHDECGTLEDPYYRNAVYALEEAIRWIQIPDDSILFPLSCKDVLDPSGDPFFYYEGSLFWKVKYNGLCVGRVIENAVQIDVPTYIFHEEDETISYLPEPMYIREEQIFNLHKAPSSLLSIFKNLEQDLTFIYQNNKNFLRRHMNDGQCYFKPGTDFFYIDLTRKDFKELLKQNKQDFQHNCQYVEKCEERATTFCKKSLDFCIAYHESPLAYFNRGLFDYLDGNIPDALGRVKAALEKAKKKDLEEIKDTILLLKGRIELEAGLYTDAAFTLSDLISKYPENKDAYLERATAYFELDHIDLSLEDYFTSSIKPEPISSNSIEMVDFSIGLAKGITQGGTLAGIELIPSILSSLQGIGHGLWAFAQDPVQVSKAFVQASQDCISFIRSHTPQETLIELVPELKELIEKWDGLTNDKRGEATGNIIGKYGVDIFAGAGITKVMKSYRELKRANNLLTFEAMSISERNKSLIKLEAAKRAQIRKEILEHGNLTIQFDKQGKHLVGHKNYISAKNKSVLEHPNPQKLVDEFAGKGIKDSNIKPGVPGYQETVNFGEFIGYAVDRDTGKKIATTWGKIHYAKDGVHIVPTNPR